MLRQVAIVVGVGLSMSACGYVEDAVDDADGTITTLPPLTDPPASSSAVRTPRTRSAAPPSSAPVSASTPAPTTSAAPTTTPTTTTPATTAAPTTTVDPNLPPDVDAAAYAVLDVSSYRWLAQHEADTPRTVGSMMKLLTAYTVMSRGGWDRTVTVPHPGELGMHPDESKFGLYEGERASREVLFRLMLIVSAGDAARVLATDTSGSQEAFVNEMNATAATLGLSGTYADNPVGLDGAGSRSTANDMAKLAATLMQDSMFRQTVVRTSVEWQQRTTDSTNVAFLTSYPGAVGIKTGHTATAGHCLAAAAERDGRLLVAVVLGAPTSSARTDAATALLDWGFRQS